MRLIFLFWNVANKPLYGRVAQVVANNNIDIVMLAECFGPSENWLNAIIQSTAIDFIEPETFAVHHRLRLFCRSTQVRMTDQYNDANGRITVRRLTLLGQLPVLLALVHFPSKINNDRDDQSFLATDLALKIRQAEQDARTERTIVVGDLNMNPYDPGMVGAMALHATMSRRDANRGTRIVNGVEYPFFYNPMWGCFGDRTPGPEGTFYGDCEKKAHDFSRVDEFRAIFPIMADLAEAV